ncbi:MAG TPA: hypothetical protein VHL78_00295 [Actinomycetota bacterium]|nr:hypothetical protein [Actinomycetota bacterium]
MAQRREATRRSGVGTLFLALALAVVGLAPAAVASKPSRPITLGVGDERFWDGQGVDRAQVPDPALCGTAGPCWEYPIRVNKGGSRLRVALSAVFRDVQDVRPWADFFTASENVYDVQILDPAGTQVARGSTNSVGGVTITAYSVEVVVERPPKGVYLVRVIPVSVSDMAFRMRAKLEGPSETSDPNALLSPNLRIIPPFEVGFSTPTATYGPGATAPNPRASCMAEEIEEAIGARASYPPPEMCLRYSMGFENVGEGPFGVEVHWTPCPLAPEDLTACLAHQRRFRSDGTFVEEEPGSAGVARFHATHGHWHYQNTWEFQLLAVEDGWSPGDPEPLLLDKGPGRKFGVMPGNELMADWRSFSQADRDAQVAATIGLQAGWGDVYEWNRSGNYADFPQTSAGEPRAGFYVLRGVTDPQGLIIESNEGDNVGYALIHVGPAGRVELVERGRGTDPWDPHKVVVKVTP